MKDDTIEGFFDEWDDKIVLNNKLLTQNLNNLAASKINSYSNPDAIDKSLQSNIADNIRLKTNNIITNFGTTNIKNELVIKDLENKVTDLENIIKHKKLKKLSNIKYSSIKSMNNGMEMSLFSTPNTFYVDKKTGYLTNTYLVGLNNGCLSVGTNDYDVYKCNDKNLKQQFDMEHIINETEYKTKIDKSIDFNKLDKSKINYPFVMMKSANNDNCLTNNHGNITVQPCYALEAQRWMPM